MAQPQDRAKSRTSDGGARTGSDAGPGNGNVTEERVGRRLPATPGEMALIVGAGLIAAVIAFVVTSRFPATYEGRATLIVGSSNGQYTDLLAAQILTQTYAQLAVTGPVLDSALQGTDLTGQVAARGIQVRAVPLRDSLTVTIIGEARDPASAAAVANAVAAELERTGPTGDPRIDTARTSVLEGLDIIAGQIATARAEIASLEAVSVRSTADESRLKDLRDRLPTLLVNQATLLGQAGQLGGNAVRVIDPAKASSGPSSPNPLLNTILALVVGLAAGIGAVALTRLSQAPPRQSEQRFRPDPPEWPERSVQPTDEAESRAGTSSGAPPRGSTSSVEPVFKLDPGRSLATDPKPGLLAPLPDVAAPRKQGTTSATEFDGVPASVVSATTATEPEGAPTDDGVPGLQAGDTAPDFLLQAPPGVRPVADDFFHGLIRRVEGDR